MEDSRNMEILRFAKREALEVIRSLIIISS